MTGAVGTADTTRSAHPARPGLAVAVRTEAVKLRRSLLPALTAGGGCLAALLSGVFVLALRDAGAQSSPVLGKAELLGTTADLRGYLDLLLTVYAAGSPLLCGIVTAWVFGREFSDRTVVDLLALPTPRSAIVLAKYAVVAVWCALLTAVVLATGLLAAAALDLPGWSGPLVADAAWRLAALYGLGVVLTTPVAFVASAGRGYLPAIGLVLVLVVLAQALATVGAGSWFPWTVPAVAVGVAGPQAAVGLAGYLLVALTAVAGGALTLAWWRYADHR